MSKRNRRKSSFRPLTNSLETIAGASSLALGMLGPVLLVSTGASPSARDESAFPKEAGGQDPDPSSSNDSDSPSNPVVPAQAQPGTETSGGSCVEEATATAAVGNEAQVDTEDEFSVSADDHSGLEAGPAIFGQPARSSSGGGPTDDSGGASSVVPPSARVGNNVPSAANNSSDSDEDVNSGIVVAAVSPGGGPSSVFTSQTTAAVASKPELGAAAKTAPPPTTVATTSANQETPVATASGSGSNSATEYRAAHVHRQATGTTQNGSDPSTVSVHPTGPVSAPAQGNATSSGQTAGTARSLLPIPVNSPTASASRQGVLQSISVSPAKELLIVGPAGANHLTKTAKVDLDSSQLVTDGGSGLVPVAGSRDQAIAELATRRGANEGTAASSGSSGTTTWTTWQYWTTTTYTTHTVTETTTTPASTTTTVPGHYSTTSNFSTTGWITTTSWSWSTTSGTGSSSGGDGPAVSAPAASEGHVPAQAAPAGSPSPGGSDLSQVAPVAAVTSNATVGSGVYLQNRQTAPYKSQEPSHDHQLPHRSVQANPKVIIDGKLTTPVEGESSSITAISAQITIDGVSEGTITYAPPTGGLSDGTTYDVRVELDPPAMTPGVRVLSMTLTEQFGTGADTTSKSTTLQGNIGVVNHYGPDGQVFEDTTFSGGDPSNYVGMRDDHDDPRGFAPWQADHQSSVGDSPIAQPDGKRKVYRGQKKDAKGKIVYHYIWVETKDTKHPQAPVEHNYFPGKRVVDPNLNHWQQEETYRSNMYGTSKSPGSPELK